MPEISVDELWLLPRPRQVRLTGGWVQRPSSPITASGVSEDLLTQTIGRVAPVRAVTEADSAWLRCRIQPDAADQAYRLEITAPVAHLVASGETGFRHGMHTLGQLLRRFQTALPALCIDDMPTFATRGVMLDVSRDRVPTMNSLFEAVDLLASLKVNHLQLYTEHTFAYAGHEEVWQGFSPLTAHEVRELDGHCRARGVELAANQNCFGHLTHWLKHPRYAHLAETQGQWTFLDVPRSGPFSLCPLDPDSIALVEELLGQLLPCFRSERVNVGCDETFDVGQGRSRQAVERRGRAAVYFEFLRKIADVVGRLGKRPMFWADVALAHLESIERIPASMTALAWGYEPNAPFGRWCRLLGEVGREVWVCPGTSSWRSIVGRTSERRANLIAAATQGSANGAAGWLVTDWGDLGHRQQWPISLHGLGEAAGAAWNADAATSFDPRCCGLHAFGDASGGVGPWLDKLGDVDLELRRVAGPLGDDDRPTALRNASALFADLHEPLTQRPTIGEPRTWQAVKERLIDLAARLPADLPALAAGELRHTLEVAQFAADRAIARRTPLGLASPARRRLATGLRGLIDEHRRLWLQRCREGGLDDSCQYYRAIADELAGTD